MTTLFLIKLIQKEIIFYYFLITCTHILSLQGVENEENYHFHFVGIDIEFMHSNLKPIHFINRQQLAYYVT